jgi:hypothetical protein
MGLRGEGARRARLVRLGGASFLLTLLTLAGLACGAFDGSSGTPDSLGAGDASSPSDGGSNSPPPDGPVAMPPTIPDGAAPLPACPPTGTVAEKDCPKPAAFWNGHCYAALGDAGVGLVRKNDADARCTAAGWAKLATLSCEEEASAASGALSSGSNYWLGATYATGKMAWTWDDTLRPFTYFKPSKAFDGGAPDADRTCIWVNAGVEWVTVPCSASSAEPFCERE